MITGYEDLTDPEFWAEVAVVLVVLQRSGEPLQPWQVPHHVRVEAERRDPLLAANLDEQLAIYGAAEKRARSHGPFGSGISAYSPEEAAEDVRLQAAYMDRPAGLAGPEGQAAR